MSDKKIQKKNLEGLLGEFSIEIPALQRDYAQGRWAQKEIGERFVKALLEVLDGDKAKGLHLDFIYGYVEGQVFVESGSAAEDSLKKLILIDGQQRLTTLWLLHLYFYKRAGKIDKKNWLGRFSYAARSGAKEFCQALLEQDFLDSEAKKPSDLIYDKSPLFGGMRLLRHDPTVAAMLNMLDWIHEGAKNKDPDELVNRLERITFDFFDMGKFGLGEELYIKMNARGKPLSEYENIKALIKKELKEKSKDEKDQKAVTELLGCIDTQWSDYFYGDDSNSGLKDRAKLFDARGKNFLYHSALFFGLLGHKDEVTEEENNENKTKANRAIDKIKSGGILGISERIGDCEKLEQLDGAISLFRRFYSNPSVKSGLVSENLDFLASPSFFGTLTESNNKKSEARSMTHKEQCYLFAILAYCRKENACLIEGDSDCKELLRYLRVARHLIENHKAENFYLLKFVRCIEELSKGVNGGDIYASMSDDKNPIAEMRFYKNILQLEVRKAKLIKSNDGKQWEEILNKLGRHPLLRGRVDFLLDFSDVNYEKSKGEQGVQKPTYTPNLQRFKKYADVMLEILKYIPSNEDKSSCSSKRLAHLQRLWFAKGGDYGPKGWYRIYYGSAFGEDFLTRNLWHEIFVAEGDTPHFYKFLEWLCNDDGMKQLCREEWDVESKDYASRSWWEQLLIGQGEHFAFINQGEGRIMRFDNEGRVRLSRGKRDSKNAANNRDLLCHGFYHYCKSECKLNVSDYKNEDKFEIRMGDTTYLVDSGDEKQPNGFYLVNVEGQQVNIDNNPYFIDFESKEDIFTEFKKVLEVWRVLPNEVAK